MILLRISPMFPPTEISRYNNGMNSLDARTCILRYLNISDISIAIVLR